MFCFNLTCAACSWRFPRSLSPTDSINRYVVYSLLRTTTPLRHFVASTGSPTTTTKRLGPLHSGILWSTIMSSLYQRRIIIELVYRGFVFLFSFCFFLNIIYWEEEHSALYFQWWSHIAQENQMILGGYTQPSSTPSIAFSHPFDKSKKDDSIMFWICFFFLGTVMSQTSDKSKPKVTKNLGMNITYWKRRTNGRV